MDRPLLAEMLGAPPGGSFWVRDMHWFNWGEELVLDCVYELHEGALSIPFQLVIKGCREILWRVYAHLKPPDDITLPVAAVANLQLGSDNHRKALHLLTDCFGLTTLYGTLSVRRIET